MARKTVLLDDYDGKELPEGTEPIHLSLGRTTYALHLSEDNHGKLLEVLNPFIESAETVSMVETARRTGRVSNKAATVDKEDQRNARAWAQSTGFRFKNAAGEEKTLGDRGRIPEAVMNAWREAGSPVMG